MPLTFRSPRAEQVRFHGAPVGPGPRSAQGLSRLEWQGLGSRQRRLRNCYNGVRAEAPPFGAPALVELELYLAPRAPGMPVETPAVRP